MQARCGLFLFPNGCAKIDLLGIGVRTGDCAGAPADDRAGRDTDRTADQANRRSGRCTRCGAALHRPGSDVPQPASRVIAPAQISFVMRFMFNAFASMPGVGGRRMSDLNTNTSSLLEVGIHGRIARKPGNSNRSFID